MLAAVDQFQNEYPASSFPCFVCLPNVAVLIGRRVVGQTASTRIDCWVNRAARFTGVARDGSRNRIARRDDVQALIAAQRELYRNSLTCIDDVDRRQIFHRREESDKVINDLIIGVSIGGVASRSVAVQATVLKPTLVVSTAPRLLFAISLPPPLVCRY